MLGGIGPHQAAPISWLGLGLKRLQDIADAVAQAAQGAGTAISAAFQKLIRHPLPVDPARSAGVGIGRAHKRVGFGKSQTPLFHEQAKAGNCGIDGAATAGCPMDGKRGA